MCCTLLITLSMVLAVDIMYGHGLSNELCAQLQPRKTKVRPCTLLTRRSALVIKVDASYG